MSTHPSLSDADVDAIEEKAMIWALYYPSQGQAIRILCAEVRRLRAALAREFGGSGVSEPLDLDAVRARYEPDRNGAAAFAQSDAASRDIPALLDALEAAQAENERHRKANLVNAVVRYAEGRGLEAWITEHINADDFDPVPWRVAESAIADRKAAMAEVDRLRTGTGTRSGVCQPTKAEPGQKVANNLHPLCGGIGCACPCHAPSVPPLPDD